ncbi:MULTISPECIES: DUF2617 family protein [Streptomyces]|uniref:DUF2617 domain-containing protein n=1 Tax=Streptomyces tsukubensis (strain DSM 42081 / NBRC 108919 / NRRL 18488 / 9993) TaxID=1114943 RepID=I2N8D7_STRT9|nr:MULTISPECIES: DUF2617 family protein [Streptomyces]AZK97154.1 hypothetical protein B7R87_27250 [Streptomyces tsukubensis]EIF93284.1 hypothetical protein [Streptomyces tsukubensis NRRL18488]MYS68203.1 DUF2617 family protein [Streptomyces sp. SID5473]QKM66878.1 DUF2617 domain-containing protein [Streptomyces tsukubensis NRRL18488]TAI44775.1 DUF2617 family protein [Streptomyces tsukubensis]
MSARALATPYQDTDADQLSFALGHPPMAALAVRELTIGGLAVQLRLLGASHQVFAGPVAETVACLPGGAGGLPDTVREIDGWQYRFRAQVHRYPPEEFTRRVARVVQCAEAHPHALYGVFPGDPEAVTALTVDAGTGSGTGLGGDGTGAPLGTGLNWRTWHTYPQSRRIVATHSRLEAR